MRRISFNPSFTEWQTHARQALREGLIPEQISWEANKAAQPGLALFRESPVEYGGKSSNSTEPADHEKEVTFRVPREFVELAKRVCCHRDERRWGLLYCVLWRLTHGTPELLQITVDKDVHALNQMDRQIRRDVHKMRAFVRFREVPAYPSENTDDQHINYVAWFEPEHFIVELNAPFFRDRFANMHWSILTPDRCVHWNGEALNFTDGVSKNMAPDGDKMEDLWRTYYGNIFNPARVKTRAMQSEMPVKYWKNLPEAHVIPRLLSDASDRVKKMMNASVKKKGERPRKQRKN